MKHPEDPQGRNEMHFHSKVPQSEIALPYQSENKSSRLVENAKIDSRAFRLSDFPISALESKSKAIIAFGFTPTLGEEKAKFRDVSLKQVRSE